jgi:heme exporter protein B
MPAALSAGASSDDRQTLETAENVGRSRSSAPTGRPNASPGHRPGGGGGDAEVAQRWTISAWEIFRKDVRVELRTRYAIGSIALFSITTLVMVSAALANAPVKSEVKAALIWVILLFAALSGLARAFVREEEAGTAAWLRLAAPGTAVYAGKLLFNLMLVFAVELVTVPLSAIFMPSPQVDLGLFVAILVAGGIGLACSATFIAAIIAQTSSGKSALFSIVAFPVLMPLLMAAAQGTACAFSDIASYRERAFADVEVLSMYAVVMTTASFLLFEYVWHD